MPSTCEPLAYPLKGPLLRGLRFAAVALCATAFLCSGAHAALTKRDAPARKPVAAAAVHAKHKAVQSAKAGKAMPATRVAKAGKQKVHGGKRAVVAAKHQVRGGRVVASLKGKPGSRRALLAQRRAAVHVAQAPRPVSVAQRAGLHEADDPLELKSSVALVVDQDTHEVLFRKNDHAVLPIASLTKLMTGVVTSEARLPMDEMITITQDDVDTERGSKSRLSVGASLTRAEMLRLALMSSENRAAHALGRTYPGGLAVFVQMMNDRARSLHMQDTRYVEPTGLSSENRSSAQDLAALVNYAYNDPLLRELSTSIDYQIAIGDRLLQYNTTNRLVRNPEWEIGLQKTGYISAAGQCLVMQAKVAGRKLIMVFLDSAGKASRIADAERVRRWVEATQLMGIASAPAAAGQSSFSSSRDANWIQAAGNPAAGL